ncbi:MAG: hypothetical protein ABWY06_21205 [Pseudomonas sp.]|uniref:hypothetical protein n=1 Tax=Pseudomonas sp. TaxID=306 RepID=UPI003397161C
MSPLASGPSRGLPPASSAPALRLQIGSLVLPGYTPREGARLAGAFERELSRLLSQAPAGGPSRQTESLQIPRFFLAPGERPERTGRRLARAIAEQLQP